MKCGCSECETPPPESALYKWLQHCLELPPWPGNRFWTLKRKDKQNLQPTAAPVVVAEVPFPHRRVGGSPVGGSRETLEEQAMVGGQPRRVGGGQSLKL